MLGRLLNTPIGQAITHLGAIITVLGIVWSVGRLHAETFIEQTVDGRISKIEANQEATKDEVREQGVAIDRVESDLGTIKQYQRDQDRKMDQQNETLIKILQELRAQ